MNDGASASQTGLSSPSAIEPPSGVSPVPASIPCAGASLAERLWDALRDFALFEERLERFYSMMPWPAGWGLKKIDGIWSLMPMQEQPL